MFAKTRCFCEIPETMGFGDIRKYEDDMLIIGVLGPEGTYSEKAARTYCQDCKLRYYDSIIDVISGIEKGEIEQGVIPIENSLEGSITTTLDQLRDSTDVRIQGEMLLPIKHCLLARGSIKDVKIILSHPQALAQCRQTLKKRFNDVETRETGSTAHAAKLAQEFTEMAAIASFDVAEKYGLNVLLEDLEDLHDHHENVTRFIVAGGGVQKPTGCDKTSLLLSLKSNLPGALYDMLGEFAKRNINLAKIESRPSRRAMGDYVFYIDIEGHEEDGVVKDAISGMADKVETLKILGSYPRVQL